PHDVGRRRVAAKLAIERVDVDGDAFALAPRRKRSQSDVASGFRGGHSAVEAHARLTAHVHEIVADAADSRSVCHWPVARDDDLQVETEHAFTCSDPVADRS